MGICAELKQISLSTLEILRQDPLLVKLFRTAKYLPESAFWRQTTWTDKSAERTKERSQKEFRRFRSSNKYEQHTLKQQFLAEWEISELDLDKSWSELTCFLAGYRPGYISLWAVPELNRFRRPTSIRQSIIGKLFSLPPSYQEKDFLNFLVVEESEWDGLPLINAVGAGTEINYPKDYGPMRYLLPHEIEQIMNGLIKLSEKGLEERFWREAEKEDLRSWMDWSDKEFLLESMIEFYNETLNYYRDAATNQRAMLLYLT